MQANKNYLETLLFALKYSEMTVVEAMVEVEHYQGRISHEEVSRYRKVGQRSSIDPMTTYIVSTQAGRVLKRPAFDFNDLISDLYNNQHVPVKIWTQSEYDAEIMAREEQERFHHELDRAIEEERKTA